VNQPSDDKDGVANQRPMVKLTERAQARAGEGGSHPPPRGRGEARRGDRDGIARSLNAIADAIGGIGRRGGGRGARPGGGIA
jgi:hypothetical protein